MSIPDSENLTTLIDPESLWDAILFPKVANTVKCKETYYNHELKIVERLPIEEVVCLSSLSTLIYIYYHDIEKHKEVALRELYRRKWYLLHDTLMFINAPTQKLLEGETTTKEAFMKQGYYFDIQKWDVMVASELKNPINFTFIQPKDIDTVNNNTLETNNNSS